MQSLHRTGVFPASLLFLGARCAEGLVSCRPVFLQNNTLLQRPVCHLLLSVKAPRDDVSALCSSAMNVIQRKCWFSPGSTARFCVWGLVCFASMTHSDTMNVGGARRGAHSANNRNHMSAVNIDNDEFAKMAKRRGENNVSSFCSFSSQLQNAATCIASPKRRGTWSSCIRWSRMARAAPTRTPTVCVCAASVR